jgi:hypothetical protein
MLIEFEDTKQHNNESNEASDIVISELRTKQHEGTVLELLKMNQ